MWNRFRRGFTPVCVAFAAAVLLASANVALADWWTEDEWYETGLSDYGYYEDYGDYYEEDWVGSEWGDWW